MNSSNQKGFSLVELLIALAIAAVTGVVMMSFFISSTRTNTTQTEILDMQQEARGGLDYFAREFRSAGYDPELSGDFGLELADAASLIFTIDTNGSRTVDVDGGNNERVRYSYNAAEKWFVRNDNYNSVTAAFDGAGDILAENIVAVGFAYAFDSDEDGDLEADAAGNVFWAVDSDPDNDAGGTWFDLDADDDGQISLADDTAGVGEINLQNTNIVARRADIRALRLWLLVQTEHKDSTFHDSRSYQVGTQIIEPEAGLRYRLRTITVSGRNLGI